jgi:hypothetical protein
MSLFIGVITMEMFAAVQKFEGEKGELEYQENLRKNREIFQKSMASGERGGIGDRVRQALSLKNIRLENREKRLAKGQKETCADKYENLAHHMDLVADHWLFNNIVTIAILLASITIGIETDGDGVTNAETYNLLNDVALGVFTLVILLLIMVEVRMVY